MTQQNLFNYLVDHCSPDKSEHINVLLASFPRRQARELRRLNMTQELATEFRRLAVEFCSQEWEILGYQQGFKPEEHQLVALNCQANPNILDSLQELALPAQAVVYNNEADFIDNVRYYSIVIQNQNDTAIFLRINSLRRQLRERFFAFSIDGPVYNKLDRYPLSFDFEIDCIFWNNVLYISNISNFERIFSVDHLAQQQVQIHVQSLTQTLPISNAHEFEAACAKEPSMAVKLSRIVGKPYIQNLTVPQIMHISSALGLGLTSTIINGTESLDYNNSRSERWKLLKLLDDDYLLSQMTHLLYEVNSKVTLP